MRDNWSAFEEDILINHYSTEGTKVQKLLPNRSKAAIQAKASQLGLKYNKNTANKNTINKNNKHKNSSSNLKNKWIAFTLCLFLGFLVLINFMNANI